MNRFFYILISGLLLFTVVSCEKDDPNKTYPLSVQLVYNQGGTASPVSYAHENITVTAKNTTSSAVFTAKTNNKGLAILNVKAGVYDISASDVISAGGVAVMFNGSKTGIVITKEWDTEGTVQNIELVESRTTQIVIKEIYTTGCQKNDNSGAFYQGGYIILYNNSEADAILTNLCITAVNPYNSALPTNYDYVDGKLWYAAEEKSPAGCAYWSWGGSTPTLKPGEQVVIALNSAIDNTKTYSNAVNFANAAYYTCYDPESGFNNPLYYPAPSEVIPQSHYLKTFFFGAGNAWPVSVSSPAFFIFVPEAPETPASILASTTNIHYYNNKVSAANARKMIPNKWILDGVELFSADASNNKKRLSNSVDGGGFEITSKLGYTAYRNVDKERTEAIASNKDKIVYNYAGGTEGSTDPSGIDAEASIKKGARIIYKDTNNSTKDFHQRKVSSIK